MTHSIELISSSMITLESLKEIQDVSQSADRVRITSQHDVAERDVVVHGDVSSIDTSVERFLVQFNVVHHLQGKGVITEQDVYTQKADDREIAEHSIKRTRSPFTSDHTKQGLSQFEEQLNWARRDSLGIFAGFGGHQLFLNLRFGDERVQDVEDTVT